MPLPSFYRGRGLMTDPSAHKKQKEEKRLFRSFSHILYNLNFPARSRKFLQDFHELLWQYLSNFYEIIPKNLLIFFSKLIHISVTFLELSPKCFQDFFEALQTISSRCSLIYQKLFLNLFAVSPKFWIFFEILN